MAGYVGEMTGLTVRDLGDRGGENSINVCDHGIDVLEGIRESLDFVTD